MDVKNAMFSNGVNLNILHISLNVALYIYVFNALTVCAGADEAVDSYREYNMPLLCGSVIKLAPDGILTGLLELSDDELPRNQDCKVGVIPHGLYDSIAFNVTDYRFVRSTELILSEGTVEDPKLNSVYNITAKRMLAVIERPSYSDRYKVTLGTNGGQTTEGRALVIHFTPGVSQWVMRSRFILQFYAFHKVSCPNYTDLRCDTGRCVSNVFSCTKGYLFGKCEEKAQCSSDTSTETEDGGGLNGLQVAAIVAGVIAVLLFCYCCRRYKRHVSDDDESIDSTPVDINENYDRRSFEDSSDSSVWNERNQEPESIPFQTVQTDATESSVPAYDTLHVTEAEVSSNRTGEYDVIDDDSVSHDQESLPPPSYDDVISHGHLYMVTDFSREDT